MKRLNFILVVLCLSIFSLNAQNVAINDDNSNADANAILDVKSTTKGVLFPRLTTAQRTTLGNATPTDGMLVFDTDTDSYWFFAGGAWTELADAKNDVPIGTILTYAGDISDDGSVIEPVPGFLLCNGAVINTNPSANPEYQALEDVIENYWGNGGDGLTETNNLPDLRGMFIRGVSGARSDGKEDPDIDERIELLPGGNGDPSHNPSTQNKVGSYQVDVFQGHKHNLSPYAAEDRYSDSGGGMLYWDPTQAFETSGPINDGENGDPRTSSETRPKNAYVHYIIKY